MIRFSAFLVVAAALIWAILAGPLGGVLQGALQPLGRWLLAVQAEFQSGLARELRGVHGGQRAAFWALMGLCLTYGFVHAAGPGHGKALLGAYGVARRVPALKLAGIGFLSAMAQGSVAVLLVVAMAGVAGMGRAGIEAVDRGVLHALGLAAMGAVGLWLIWRALARLARPRRSGHAAGAVRARLDGPFDGPVDGPVDGPASRMLAAARRGEAPRAHVYCTDETCPDCHAAHLPPADAMLRAASLREVAMLVAAVAVRPCSGALILLLLTWQMGLLWVGILGTYAMALGTAGVAAGLALALAIGRDGVLAWGGRRMAGSAGPWLAAAIEAGAGLALVIGVMSVVLAA